MEIENWISVAAIIISVVTVVGGYYSQINKRLIIMEQRIIASDQKFSEVDVEILEVKKDNHATREAVNAIKVSMAKIETYVDMSKDIMARLDGYLRKSEK